MNYQVTRNINGMKRVLVNSIDWDYGQKYLGIVLNTQRRKHPDATVVYHNSGAGFSLVNDDGMRWRWQLEDMSE